MHHLHRIPSNRMPAYVPERVSAVRRVLGWLLVLVPAVVICVAYPLVPAGVVAIILLGLGVMKWNDWRHPIEIEPRTRESICTFARAFDCRSNDTWVVRAVYETLRDHAQMPIQADDMLESDLMMEDFDVYYAADQIAQRTGRPLERCEENPIFAHINTARDLVAFFQHQPRRSGHA